MADIDKIELFNNISFHVSEYTTKKYSTSFSLGILCLDKFIRQDIYNIYGFVRFADEIVDSFQGYNKELLFQDFKKETYKAIEQKISLNPILNSFQKTVNEYNIDLNLIETFLKSMEMDLYATSYNEDSYQEYILGSAEVVGLMCLKVFVNGDLELYTELIPYAKKLGSAFQKINFLRDIREDYGSLGRIYFPNIKNISDFAKSKQEIEKEIELEFNEALIGINKLPHNSRRGVLLAYNYYMELNKIITKLHPDEIMTKRISVSTPKKIFLLLRSYFS